jgi:hypothetical protein
MAVEGVCIAFTQQLAMALAMAMDASACFCVSAKK